MEVLKNGKTDDFGLTIRGDANQYPLSHNRSALATHSAATRRFPSQAWTGQVPEQLGIQ
jgi:hypothetical protein